MSALLPNQKFIEVDVVRDSQFVVDGLVQLNLTPEQGDHLFIQASKL